MAPTTMGKLEVFDPKQHNFPKYVQRVQLYFKANNITEDRKKAVFLSALCYEMYEILTNIFTTPETEDFDSLARSYVWWPHLVSDIFNKVRHCHICQNNHSSAPKAPYTHGNVLIDLGQDYI